MDLQDLTDGPAAASEASCKPQSVDDEFYPYPNEYSFCLGDWYWNHGVQKSHESFRKLLDIIGDPGFRPDDM